MAEKPSSRLAALFSHIFHPFVHSHSDFVVERCGISTIGGVPPYRVWSGYSVVSPVFPGTAVLQCRVLADCSSRAMPASSETLFGKEIRSAETSCRGSRVPPTWKSRSETAKQVRHRSRSILRRQFELFEVMQNALFALWSLWANFMATIRNQRRVGGF
jgi:hypothetical protein